MNAIQYFENPLFFTNYFFNLMEFTQKRLEKNKR